MLNMVTVLHCRQAFSVLWSATSMVKAQSLLPISVATKVCITSIPSSAHPQYDLVSSTIWLAVMHIYI